MKSAYLLLALLLCSSISFAQLPPACTINNPPMAKQCNQACILCELDGYSSATTQTIQGQQIPGYCTQVVHSMGYIGFVAGSTNLSIQVDVGACTLGNSIEMGIYQTNDCQNFELVGDCNTAMFTGNNYILSNTTPLVPGCPYFLVTDNNGPAACAFTVTVIAGNASATPVAAPSVPSGPTSVCPGSTVEYTIPPVYGACMYRWTAPAGTLINGSPSPAILNHDEGTTVTVTWGNTGGQLCVSGSNPCSQGPPTCLPVVVSTIPPTILPTVHICNGDSYDWIDGNTYAGTQLLSITYVTDIGCDSTVRQQLIVDPPIISNLGVIRLCEGSCTTVGNGTYCTSGFFQETVPAFNGCDSTIFFSILLVESEAVIAPADTLSCQQDTIVLDGSGSTGGGSYIWQDSSGNILATSDTLLVSQSGLYNLIIEINAAGLTCRDTAQTTVVSNQQLPDLSATGDSLTCDDPMGQISASSTTPDVSYAWTGPGGFQSNMPNPNVSTPGFYIIELTAPNGCVKSDTVEVSSNQEIPMLLTTVNDTLTCQTDSVLIGAQSDIPGTEFLWSGPQNFSSGQADTAVTFAGQYVLLATAPNGCTASDTLTVFENTTPPQLTVTGDTLNCQQQTGQISANIIPANSEIIWTGPQNFTANIPDPIVSLSGNYTAIVTAPNGCTATEIASVQADTVAPSVSTSGGTITCTLDSIALMSTVEPSGSSISWAGPQNFSSNTPNPLVGISGMYLLTATAQNGCTATATAAVLADTLPPQLSASGDTITCTLNTGMLSLDISPAGSTVLWSGPGNFSSTLLNPVVSEPGVYSVTGTAANGCTATTQATVVADASIPQVSATGGTISCNQTSLFLSASVSPAGSNISWTGPQSFTSSLLNPEVSLSGQYTLLATTNNGCTASVTVDVLADTAAPTVTLAGGTVSCAQPMINLNAVVQPDTSMISWTGPQGFSSNQLNPGTSTPGNYTAIVTAGNGCSTTAMVNVAADTISPTVSATGGTITCTQPTINLMSNVAPAGSTLQWTGPQSFSSNQANPSTDLDGIYTLMATAANGCTASVETNVQLDTVSPQLSTTGNIITCSQPIVNISAVVQPTNAQLLWNGPQNFTATIPSPDVSLPGTYMVLATSANGCTATANAIVQIDTVAPQITAAGGLLTCLQNTLTLSATVNPVSSAILWSGPQAFSSTMLNPTVSVAGNYILLATAGNGCTASATAVVTADSDFPVVNVAGGTITCTQTSVTLTSSVTPLGSSVSWTGPQNFSSSQPDPIVNIPGSYVITATTNAGCSASSTAFVQIDTIAPQVATTTDTLSCNEPIANISVIITPVGSSVLWAGPQNFSSSSANESVSIPGPYTVTVTAPNGCTALANALVQADTATPQLQASGGLINCTNSQIQLSLIVQPAGSAVLWTGPQNFSSNLVQPTVSTAGTYTVTATANNGCTATSTVVVNTDVTLPQINLTGGTITCDQTFVTLVSSITPGGGNLVWSGPQGFTSNLPDPEVPYTGSYTLSVTLQNGCSSSSTVVVDADTIPPLIDVFGNDITCREDSTVLEAVVQPANSNITWSGPQNFTSNQTSVTSFIPGVYTAIATAPNGCSASGQVTVAGLNQPTWTLDLGPDLEAEEFEPLFPHPVTDLPIIEWAEINWEFPVDVLGMPCTDCNLPVIKLPRSGTVIVHLTDPNGCTQSASYFIQIQQTHAIYVPNVFKPESSTGNQIFEFYIGTEARVVEVRDFRIFDRWGGIVHERPSFLPGDPGHGWDGTVRGKKALPGVYVWYAEFEFANGRIKLLKGDVTLFR